MGSYRLRDCPGAARMVDPRCGDPQHPRRLRPAAMGHNSAEYIYTVAMAMKAAFADRNPLLGDPDFVDVPLDWMMSKERAAQWRAKINAGEPIEVDFTSTGTPTTTHVSVVDKWGNCVALTHSLGASSGVITPGLGFMYNNSMINFHPYPGHPNSIAPTKSRTTGMCPTIIYKGGKPVVVLGAPGPPASSPPACR